MRATTLKCSTFGIIIKYASHGLPHEQRVADCRHCKIRKVDENDFGILSNKFSYLYYKKGNLLSHKTELIAYYVFCTLHSVQAYFMLL